MTRGQPRLRRGRIYSEGWSSTTPPRRSAAQARGFIVASASLRSIPPGLHQFVYAWPGAFQLAAVIRDLATCSASNIPRPCARGTGRMPSSSPSSSSSGGKSSGSRLSPSSRFQLSKATHTRVGCGCHCARQACSWTGGCGVIIAGASALEPILWTGYRILNTG